MTHAEFEKLVGGKVPAKVLWFFVTPETMYYRIGELWFEANE